MWPGENKLSGKLAIAHVATKNPKVKEGAKYFQIFSKKRPVSPLSRWAESLA